MQRLRDLVGVERSLGNVAETLHFYAASLRPKVVGAFQITCADETEHECSNAFQRGFVQYYVPPVKFAESSAFRIANLGGRYEWGAIRIAEQHFATPESRDSYKLLVVKINSHVAITEGGSGVRFGTLRRYGVDSICCGALDGLLHGAHEPWAELLRELFTSEQQDRIATLLDTNRVPPDLRALHAGLVGSRLQARKVVLDIQDYRSWSPTLYLVLPSVTINRADRDTEIVCGLYTVDERSGDKAVEYFGLGDDPGQYRIEFSHGRATVTDDQLGEVRPGRDHRQLVMNEWREGPRKRPPFIADDRLVQITRDAAVTRGNEEAKALLATLMPVLAEITPVAAAVTLFAQGLVGVHHAFRIHRLARTQEGVEEARKILTEVCERLDGLDPDQARTALDLLVRELGG